MCRKISNFIIGVVCVLSCFPIFILLVGGITGEQELMIYLKGIFEEQGQTYFVLFPSFPTLKGFLELLLDTPEFYMVFWNSVKLTCFIVIGQLIFSVPAAWGFSRWKGKLSNRLFYIYTILMLLPFQVTMLSNYLVIDKLGILDTHAAVILPAVFSTFPVFIIYRYFSAIPEEIYEAFSLESSSKFQLFWHMGLPLAMSGIKATILLNVIEYWNMIEQPLLFLKTPSLWPFSIYIPDISKENIQYVFVFSFIVLIPMLFILFWGKDEIKNGIGTMVLKG